MRLRSALYFLAAVCLGITIAHHARLRSIKHTTVHAVLPNPVAHPISVNHPSIHTHHTVHNPIPFVHPNPLTTSTHDLNVIPPANPAEPILSHLRYGKWKSLGGTFHRRPAAVSPEGKTMAVSCSDPTNHIMESTYAHGKWSEWVSTEPDYFSYRQPDVAAFPNGDMVRFSVWRFYMLMVQRKVNGIWQPWENTFFLTSQNPLALPMTSDTMAFLLRGRDNDIWCVTRKGAEWNSWHTLGGSFMSRPTGVTAGDGTMHIFARDLHNIIHMNSYVGGKFTGWSSTGQLSTCDAEVTLKGSWIAVAICPQQGGTAVGMYDTGASRWQGWLDIGGTSTGPPAIAAPHDGEVQVYVRDGDFGISMRAWTLKTGWMAWHKMVGIANVASVPTVIVRKGHVEVFVNGADMALWHAKMRAVSR